MPRFLDAIDGFVFTTHESLWGRLTIYGFESQFQRLLQRTTNHRTVLRRDGGSGQIRGARGRAE